MYQFGGRGAHTRLWFAKVIETKNGRHTLQDTSKLAQAIVNDSESPVEVILGEHPNFLLLLDSAVASCRLQTFLQASFWMGGLVFFLPRLKHAPSLSDLASICSAPPHR